MHSFGFPPLLRLLKPQQYQKVLSQGKRLTVQKIRAAVFPNALEYPRLGLVMAKRHISKAHQRNYVKRFNREMFRVRQHQLASVDIVILLNPAAKGSTNILLKNEMISLWEKLLYLYPNIS